MSKLTTIEDFKSEIRAQVEACSEEKEYDRFLAREGVIQAVGVGDFDLFLDEFKVNFRNSIKTTTTKPNPTKNNPADPNAKKTEKAEPIPKITIKELTTYKKPIRRVKRGKRK
jgi:hypothetical protein